MAPGLVGPDVSLVQVTAVHSIDNCVVLVKHCVGTIVASRAIDILRHLSLAARNQGRQQW